MKSIGFVGLGAMGSVMAPLLVKAKFNVIGYDLKKRLEKNTGVKMAASLEELVGCDAIMFMLPDGAVVSKVALDLAKNGFEGLFVDMSSSAPEQTITLGKTLEREGIHLIDAPVSGGQKKAALGTLMVMVGGDPTDLSHARRLLECFGEVIHVGPLAAGHAMKSLNNYVSASGLLASMQALATAQTYGIQAETFTEVINGSTGRNNTTEVKLRPFIITREYNSGFLLSLMAKDVGIASHIIKLAGFDNPTTEALKLYLDHAVDFLGPKVDHTGLYEFVNPKVN